MQEAKFFFYFHVEDELLTNHRPRNFLRDTFFFESKHPTGVESSLEVRVLRLITLSSSLTASRDVHVLYTWMCVFTCVCE